jgi:hypothetical protein
LWSVGLCSLGRRLVWGCAAGVVGEEVDRRERICGAVS